MLLGMKSEIDILFHVCKINDRVNVFVHVLFMLY